jgi:uncharacterized damage-inducible protein DinB
MTYTSAEAFLKYYASIRRRTKRVIACIPPDQVEWRPKRDRFSFGDQIRHIAATERYMFAENVQHLPARYHGCSNALADGYDQTVDFMDRLHQESIDIFQNLTPQDMLAKCRTPGNTELAIWKWLRAMIEHEIHHRSQMYVYLGLLDIEVPQLFGLSAEELEQIAADQ